MNDGVEGESGVLKKKRPRRAIAPPTAEAGAAGGSSETPDADWSDWLASPSRREKKNFSGHEQWINEQRPPHWD